MATKKKETEFIPPKERSREEKHMMSVRGGQKAGQIQKTYKTLRQCSQYLGEQIAPKKFQKMVNQFLDTQGQEYSNDIALMVVTLKKALAGDIQAARLYREMRGELKDVQQTNIQLILNVNEKTKSAIERLTAEDDYEEAEDDYED